MEKFQKYCLSVLLVIISSNISAQTNNGTLKSVDCRYLYEIYSHFLNSGECKALEKTVLNVNSKRKLSIHEKRNAVDLLSNSGNLKNQNNYYKTESGFSVENKYCQLLVNYFRAEKNNFITENLYFKTKVSKIRNKDYLDMI